MLTVNEATFGKTVLKAPQPVLINFWAPWCGLCRLLHPILEKMEIDRDGDLLIVHINADENFKLANFYQLKSLPTLILLEGGQVIQRLDRFDQREDLEKVRQWVERPSLLRSA